MSIVINHIKRTLSEVFNNFFSSDMDVISDDAKKILSDRENQQAYLNGLKQLRQQEKDGINNPKVRIRIKHDEELVLMR